MTRGGYDSNSHYDRMRRCVFSVANPLVSDTDQDGLSDGQEVSIGTSPAKADTDGDELPDNWEVQNSLDPLSAMGDDGASGDPDGDGVDNHTEYELGTNPHLADTDNDGLSDGDEATYGSDPLVADTDGDGISDGVEVNTYGSNPRSTDTDADGLADAQEAALGTALNNPDSDGDGLLDGWEVVNDFNPLSTPGNGESGVDTDGDGLTNLQEQAAGSNPKNADSDGDGLSDSEEFLTHHTNPLVADTDDDGMTDKQEVDAGYRPLDLDMDRDGMSDGWENAHGLDPQDSTGDDGADGDIDNDGLSNIDEYLNGTNPNLPDSDGDGVPDGVEVANGSDPNDASDGGQAPSVDRFREVEFNINGDYAAWEMTIEGLGPDDTRTRKISMGRPNAANTTTLKMRKGNSYRLSMRWLNCDGHNDNMSPWYCWQALIDGLPRQKSFDDSYSEGYCVRISQSNNIVVGNGWIAENEDGLLTSHVHASWRNSYGGLGAGNVAQGLSATLYVLDDPKLVFDYDRDGSITDLESTIARDHTKTFRFWVNDDLDLGDVCAGNDYNSDSPFAQGRNCIDGVVNGRRDLEDFTPVWIDMRGVFPPETPQTVRDAVQWVLQANCVNAVWTSYSRDEAGSFLTDDKRRCGSSFLDYAYEADVVDLGQGVELPNSFLEMMQSSADKGVILVEGRSTISGFSLTAKATHLGNQVLRSDANISVSSVMDMFRWLCLRHVAGDTRTIGSTLGSPSNRPDEECNDQHIFFIHGFNVNPDEAVSTAVEMFKRLWQSGSESMFTAVDWYGDEAQMDNLVSNWAFDGTASPDYYVNVFHAFQTAGALASETALLPGSERVFIAHSLGNILTSSAIKDHALVYSKYYMLNAAVSREAYDPLEYEESMVDPDWANVTNASYRAANWHGLFEATDFRSTLSWKGRFSGITNAVNCYSSTEDVVGNIDRNKALVRQSVWVIQETLKGTSALQAINVWPWFNVGCEGGWGINTYYALNPTYYLGGFRGSVNALSREDVITHPLFTPFRIEESNMHATNLFSIVDTNYCNMLRARFLGDAIQAEGFAAGANVLDARSCISNISLMAECMSNTDRWPNERRNGQNGAPDGLCWYHSDWKNLAYFFCSSAIR